MQDIKRRASREQARARNPLAKLNFKGTFGLKTDLQSGYNGGASCKRKKIKKKERKKKREFRSASVRVLARACKIQFKNVASERNMRFSNVSSMKTIFEEK